MLDGGLKDVTETEGMNILGDVIGRLDVVAMPPTTHWLQKSFVWSDESLSSATNYSI